MKMSNEDWIEYLAACKKMDDIKDPGTRWNVAKLRVGSQFRSMSAKHYPPVLAEYAENEVRYCIDNLHHSMAIHEALGWAVALGNMSLAQEVVLKLHIDCDKTSPDFCSIPQVVSSAFVGLFGHSVETEHHRLSRCRVFDEPGTIVFDSEESED